MLGHSIKVGKSLLSFKVGDITKSKVDAIVNAANPRLAGGGGVDGAIHKAGGPSIARECAEIISKIGRLDTGAAVATSAGALSAKFVIHTVGPVWHGGEKGEPELLKNAYINSLKVAIEIGAKTVAFPSISTGIYGYPVEKAAKVAVKTVYDFLKENEWFKEVTFVLFDERTFSVYLRALKENDY